ncbi:MAG: hypothetical protein D6723_01950 [Acidobacteria bacterium]|nr:MAG: hypothetical protein D6723_01950 [Acidobacteriota bacterium]
MSCRRWERMMALYIGGELSPWRERRVERHLRSCSTCRSFIRDLEDMRGALHSLRGEPVDHRVLEGIRRSVLAEMAAHQSAQTSAHGPGILRRWPWPVGLAGVVLVVVAATLVFFQWSRTEVEVSESPRVRDTGASSGSPARLGKPSMPTLSARKDSAPPPNARIARTRRASESPRTGPPHAGRPPLKIPDDESTTAEPPSGSDQLVVKLVTENPDIVIYWLVDREGE